MEYYKFSENIITPIVIEHDIPDTIAMSSNGIFLDYVELSEDFVLFAYNKICKIFTYFRFPSVPTDKYYVYFEKFDVLVIVEDGFLGLNSFSKEIATFVEFLSSFEFTTKTIEKPQSVTNFIEQWKKGKDSELSFFEHIPYGMDISKKDLYNLYRKWANDLYYKPVSEMLFIKLFTENTKYQQISILLRNFIAESVFLFGNENERFYSLQTENINKINNIYLDITNQFHDCISKSDLNDINIWFK